VKYRLVLIAELEEETVELLSEWSFAIEWLRSFVVNTLGLNIIELKVEKKGEKHGNQ